MPSTTLRLDDLYKMTSHIFSEQNAQRSPATTYAHFVEVCGMLTIHNRSKKKEGIKIEDALCKALAWYFPLLARFKVSSAEDLIFRKFPYACPYCRLKPHKDSPCKTIRGTEKTVNHTALKKVYGENKALLPSTLDEWQEMFQEIYPRNAGDWTLARSTQGLFEELGELGEAVRVFDRYPNYFAGEAADVFSYLMGVANEHKLRLEQEEERTFSFEAEFIKRYPGLCVQCGYEICVCPHVPEATIGRMAKELKIEDLEKFFNLDAESFAKRPVKLQATWWPSWVDLRQLVSLYPRIGAKRTVLLLFFF